MGDLLQNLLLGFSVALTCASAIAAGVAPALGLKTVAAGEALKAANRGLAGDRRFAVRGALVVVQIALSLMLVTAAGLFLRSFASLNQLPLGFVPEPLLLAELNLQAGATRTEERSALAERLRAAAATVPGVRSTGIWCVALIQSSSDRHGTYSPNGTRWTLSYRSTSAPVPSRTSSLVRCRPSGSFMTAPSAVGIRPAMIAKVVMRIGRRRVRHASTIASRSGSPAARSVLA